MEIKEIAQFRDRYKRGDMIVADNPGDTGKELYKVEILAKYPSYAIVFNGNYRWCRHWIDLMKMN